MEGPSARRLPAARRLAALTAQVAAAPAAVTPAAVAATGGGAPRRLCLVTGGSSGIGEAVCARFAAEGFETVSISRRPSRLQNVRSMEIDLAKPEGPKSAADAVLALLAGGKAQVCLVHCASNYPSDSAQQPDLDGLDGCLRLNVTAPADLTAKLLPSMAEGSSILFVGSTLSEKAVGGKLSYATAKHAMTGLMRATAQDLLGSGIHTALICPGIAYTEMVRNAVAGKEEAFEAFVKDLQGRFVTVEEIASFMFDVSRTSVLHGTVLHCNGGQRER